MPESKQVHIMAKSVSYLGQWIDAEELQPLPDKVAAVLEAPLPQDVAQLKSYLGLLSYYSMFLPNLSMVVAPITNCSVSLSHGNRQTKKRLLSQHQSS